MRIGVVGPTGPDFFAENISDALSDMGHTVTLLGSARPVGGNRLTRNARALARQEIPRFNDICQRHIVRTARQAECQIVINVDSHLSPDAVTRLKADGSKVALWFGDSMLSLGRGLMLVAPYDMYFLKEPHLLESVKSNLGLPAHYLPEACNPRWHRPLTEPGLDPYLVMAGNMRPSRVRLLERLIERGVPVRIYGPGFPRWLSSTLAAAAHTRMYLAREDKARVFRSAAGVLNTLHPAEVHGANARLFEATGSGAAVITEYRSAIPELFEPGEEILTFHNFEELVDKAHSLIDSPSLTRKLGDAAALRAHKDHTYARRLEVILDRLS